MLSDSTKVGRAAKEAFATSLGRGEASYCSQATAAAESGQALTIIGGLYKLPGLGEVGGTVSFPGEVENLCIAEET